MQQISSLKLPQMPKNTGIEKNNQIRIGIEQHILDTYSGKQLS
jgi:hypothetical protein